MKAAVGICCCIGPILVFLILMYEKRYKSH
jgi:hypothetical protein